MSTVLYVVVPCYNEEAVLPVTAPQFLETLRDMIRLRKISSRSRILFVDDGSKDRTWDIISGFSEKTPFVKGISQSRNRGHQNAIVAGMMEAMNNCDAVITIDCDGQDDIGAMTRMVDAFLDGNDIVYGVRSSRKSDTWFKRTTAQGYYRLLNSMGCGVIYNHADYRLVSKRVLEAFSDYKEVNLFLRGLFPLVGFSSTSVLYERHEREAGKSHYPLRKMTGLAVDGITSLTIKPLEFIFKLGIAVALISMVGIIWSIVRFLTGATVAGWASLSCIICFMGGVQLVSMGIIGEYVGKTYLETKHRPRYIIAKRTDNFYEKDGEGDDETEQ